MKFRKRPVIIDAEVYRRGLEDGFEQCCKSLFCIATKGCDECLHQIFVPFIATLEGNHRITEGDFIITGVKGERYPCKPEIFHMTYEEVSETC